MTLNDLKRAVKRHQGATIEDDSSGRWKVYQVVAPDGMVWGGNDSSCLKVEWLDGDRVYKDEAIADAIERLESEELVEAEGGDDSYEDDPDFDWDTLLPPASPVTVLDFYRGGKDYQRRTIEEILAWDDRQLERAHDYIQVLFPLPEASPFNPRAPIIDAGIIAAFEQDAALRANLGRAFARMLAFYGFRLAANGTVGRAATFPVRLANWLSIGNHNYRRLTRILRCLTLLGLPKQAQRLFDALTRVYGQYGQAIGPEALEWWTEALDATMVTQ